MSGELISTYFIQDYIEGIYSDAYELSFNENSSSIKKETGKFCGRIVSCLASVSLPLACAINTAYSIVMAAIEPPVQFLYTATQSYRGGNGVLLYTCKGIEEAETHFRIQVKNILDNGLGALFAGTGCINRIAYTPVFEVVNVAGSAVCCASYLLRTTIAAIDLRFGSAGRAFT